MTTNGTTPKPRDIWQDAFFEEERAKGLTAGDTVNPATGAPYNRFDVPLVLSAWKTARTQPADPLHDPAIAITVEPGTPEVKNYSVFAPSVLRAFSGPTDEVPVALLAGTGSQFNRHGVRTAFEDNGKAVIVNIPGIEPSSYGYGITQAMLVAMLASVGVQGRPRVRTLGAFSTGYRGINGIVNNTKSSRTPPAAAMATGSTPGTGLDLSGVRKIIYYDALYRGDEPPPGKTTSRALAALHEETGGTCELVFYDVTDAGTPHPLRVTAPAGMKSTKIDLKTPTTKYSALVLARVIDNGIKQGYTDDAEVKKHGGQAVLDLIASHLTARGTIGSAPGSGTTDVTTWAPDALCASATAAGQRLITNIIKPQGLVGWAVPNLGEFQHDAHLFEFYWEHLVP